MIGVIVWSVPTFARGDATPYRVPALACQKTFRGLRRGNVGLFPGPRRFVAGVHFVSVVFEALNLVEGYLCSEQKAYMGSRVELARAILQRHLESILRLRQTNIDRFLRPF